VVSKATLQQRSSRHIVRSSKVLGGEPTVQGTRVPVRAIVLTHRLYPDIARLRVAFPMLSSEDIVEALAFYHANQEEIERYIAENAMNDEG